MKISTIIFVVLFCLSVNGFAQVVDFKDISMDRMIEVVKAEDELRYDKTLEGFLKHPNPLLRKRSALAAGRIGDEKAIPMLESILLKDTKDIRQMSAFAIGEIESVRGADAILKVLKNLKDSEIVRARAIEAAGKIVAANAEDDKSKMLGKAIIENLEFEAGRRSRPSSEVILLGITATLRAKPEGADQTLAKFLGYSDWRIRADALNTLARLRAKNIYSQAKELLLNDENPIVRANAARILGGSDDKALADMILNVALSDKDLRVRVNAIRSLGSLKKIETADKLLMRGGKLLAEYKESKYDKPIEQNELIDITNALGNILKETENEKVVKFLKNFRELDEIYSSEIEIALARISPANYLKVSETVRFKKIKKFRIGKNKTTYVGWQKISNVARGLAELADLEDHKAEAQKRLELFLNEKKVIPAIAIPGILNSYSKFKTKDLEGILRENLKTEDVIVRSTAANLLGDIKPESPEQWMGIYRGLSNALYEARDDKLNDASLAILGALEKQYKQRPPLKVKFPYMSPFISGLKSPDYLIRRKAAEIYGGFNTPKPDPMTVGDPSFKPFEIPKDFRIVKFDGDAKNGARSRVKRANYRKALSRKNGEWGAILKTEKGSLTIDLFPEDAPLTVDNFIKLARSGYFNGLEIHRVIPNFVMQDGDPRGDGSGGPGWQIRCEINQIQYERGMVGMALSGKDTGGSQWFVTHSPQPHLDGGYTIFGKVNVNDMKIVDNLVRGDKILKVKIVGK